MRHEERAHPNQPAIRWAQPPQDVEDSRPGLAEADVTDGEIVFRIDEGAPARVSLGRYRISVQDLRAFLQRFRIAS